MRFFAVQCTTDNRTVLWIFPPHICGYRLRKCRGCLHSSGMAYSAATCTAYLHFCPDSCHNTLEHFFLGGAQLADCCRGRGMDIVLWHLHGIHARQHAGHFWLVSHQRRAHCAGVYGEPAKIALASSGRWDTSLPPCSGSMMTTASPFLRA